MKTRAYLQLNFYFVFQFLVIPQGCRAQATPVALPFTLITAVTLTSGAPRRGFCILGLLFSTEGPSLGQPFSRDTAVGTVCQLLETPWCPCSPASGPCSPTSGPCSPAGSVVWVSWASSLPGTPRRSPCAHLQGGPHDDRAGGCLRAGSRRCGRCPPACSAPTV